MVTVVWPVVSSILSTMIIGGIGALYRTIKSSHTRLDRMEQHLRRQDKRIAYIEGKVSR